MDDVSVLMARSEIEALMARYFRAVDTRDRPLFETIFLPDSTCDYRGAASDPSAVATVADAATDRVLEGLTDIVAGLRAALEGSVSAHQGTNSEIIIADAGTARGIWAMQDWVWWTKTAEPTRMRGFGHYHNDFVCKGDRWWISALRLTRLRVELDRL
ncbi:nuclear transport factor 2 family protein [Sphingobium yanoikuyae]|jgi:hypothetical protein|uniref:Nuclear transport factor 2 family protein n=1 Tax=Sphingobium yanoikuyae TaxID=13690 RepID=A0A6M4G525_SPHYA|nr:nuclear transport factor 2 family protein [Sphingobium yanoikuyae]QJR02422.1 nuclear transport factor 2 family protein [Sphingobium yanoikuyae]